MTPERETKFQPQANKASVFLKVGWYPHWTCRSIRPSSKKYAGFIS